MDLGRGWAGAGGEGKIVVDLGSGGRGEGKMVVDLGWGRGRGILYMDFSWGRGRGEDRLLDLCGGRGEG